MRIIDNVNDLLGDDFKAEVRSGSRVRIAASTFSIYAYEALKAELEGLEELDFIFTSPTFNTAKATDKPSPERREFYIPRHGAGESTLYGSEFEIRLRNKMTQRAIARECAEWVRRKARFRSSRTGAPMQQFMVVDDRAAYQPLQGFTSADLGYERGNAVSNLVTKVDGTLATQQYLRVFDQIWDNEEHLEDVTATVAEHIAAVYAENAPSRIYFQILYNIFSGFLEDINEDVLPNDLTGYQDSLVWKSLYNFQRDAAVGIINKLETYNGCILADSVGLGKTFTALAVIKYYELRNKSVLVLSPKKLGDNWTNFKGNLTTNIFVGDRFNYDVLAHTDLLRTRGESFGMPLDRVNWGNYDLVVIDESHNFRNADFSTERETRYQRLMRQVIRAGVKTKVLMLSATPVNNHFTDLRNQLALAYEGESHNLSSKLDLSTSIEEVFRRAQAVFNEWSKLPQLERTAETILPKLDFDFFSLLDAVTIARSRKHIQAFYDTSEIGAFPDRMPPISIRSPLTDLPDVPSFNDMFTLLSSMTLAVYAPLSYVFPSRRSKYEELYGNLGGGKNQVGGEIGNLGQGSRERGIQKLMTVNLLKRLESSVEAFRLTLGRLADTVEGALVSLDLGLASVDDVAGDFTGYDEDDDFEFPERGTIGGKVRIDIQDLDVESWRRDLERDVAVLATLQEGVAKVTPEHDAKLRTLKDHIAHKVEFPLNEGNRKVLVFSAFADTAEYLYRELATTFSDAGLELAIVTGQGSPKTTLGRGHDFQQVLTMFSPRSKSRHLTMRDETREIDILIGTDCISEGQNLQDCDYVINYDIHWNPVRIIQRFGRIDRIGSTNARVQLVNFWPDLSLDEYINLKERVESRMVIADLAATADDNVLLTSSSDTEFRREQLRRLQDEVIELEDVRTGISITDLGLNDFRMDLYAYVKDHGDLEGSPKGLHAVIPARRDIGLVPGVIFALRNVNAGAEIHDGNRLHPHYLVYLDSDGHVVADQTEAKRLLDLVRAGCRPFESPVVAICEEFNAETRDGAQMDRYSNLLDDAVRSLIASTGEQEIASLFTPGTTTALTHGVQGLDDFELIAFLVVRDSA